MLINFIKNNITLVAISIFLVLFSIIAYYKPGFLFNKDGSIRKFGIGYKRKTVIPIWLLSIIFAILAYYLVLYLINYTRFKNI